MSPTFIIPNQFYDFDGLIYSTLFLFSFCFLFSRLLFRSYTISLFVASFKSFIYFFYFALFFNATNFNFIDSITYIEHSVHLAETYSVFEILSKPNELIMPFSGGHTFYYIWSILAVKILGPFYFSPIVFNILSTFLGAYYLKNIVKFFNLNFSTSVISIFYLFHWEIITWSSFFNLRDVLIQVSILSVCYYLVRFVNQRNFYNLFVLLCSLYVLSALRIHVAYLLSFVSIFWLVYTARRSIPWIFLVMPVLFLYYSDVINMASLFLKELSFNILHLLFSPLPRLYTIYTGYGFLFFASLINILLVPFCITGFITLFKKRNIEFLIFLSIFFTLLIVFSFYSNVQGPRQRLMITPFYYTFGYFGVRQFFLRKYF